MKSKIGKYILNDGSLSFDRPDLDRLLGVVFEETSEEFVFLTLADECCLQKYNLQEIIGIAQCYNKKYGDKNLWRSVRKDGWLTRRKYRCLWRSLSYLDTPVSHNS